MTTNAVLLAEQAAGLKAAGLKRVNVSLDTFKPERFAQFAAKPNWETLWPASKKHAEWGLIRLKPIR